MIKQLLKEIKKHIYIYLVLLIILVAGFILRAYRIDSLLGFYYDQGRDALVIWDLIFKGKFFLIGPTTGLAGIFRGPYYYYLIAPFYFLGGGNPVWPSIFLSLTTVFGVFILYKLGSEIQSRETGIIAAGLGAFSFYIVTASRWLSNPTPMLLFSMILVWAMFKVIEGKRWGWPIISLILGLSFFNFGSSGELFYFPAIFIFLIWQWKNRPDTKNLIISIVLFVSTFAPLVLFDLKHEGILRNNILATFVGEKSFTLPTKYLFENRNQFYANLFPRLIFHSFTLKENISLVAILGSFFLFIPKFLKNKKIVTLLILLSCPIIGLYFYQGNYTVLYDYYLTGYYLIFLLLIGVVLGKLWESSLGKTFVIIFAGIFLVNNLSVLNFKLSDDLKGPESIAFLNQKQAIDWIYSDAKDEKFNVDVYVPPVIPYAYDYLFRWYGGRVKGREPEADQVKLLYTLYEVDPPHPERLEAWLKRQKGIGKVVDTVHFGGITVERRERI